MKKTNKGTESMTTDLRVLGTRVAEAEKQVKIARDKTHRAKVEFKQAKKAFKQAKKAAKQARKLAKVAAKKLKPTAKKTIRKASKPPTGQPQKRVAAVAQRRPSAPKAVSQPPQPATPLL